MCVCVWLCVWCDSLPYLLCASVGCVLVCVCVCVGLSICVSVCMCVLLHTRTHTRTHSLNTGLFMFGCAGRGRLSPSGEVTKDQLVPIQVSPPDNKRAISVCGICVYVLCLRCVVFVYVCCVGVCVCMLCVCVVGIIQGVF